MKCSHYFRVIDQYPSLIENKISFTEWLLLLKPKYNKIGLHYILLCTKCGIIKRGFVFEGTKKRNEVDLNDTRKMGTR